MRRAIDVVLCIALLGLASACPKPSAKPEGKPDAAVVVTDAGAAQGPLEVGDVPIAGPDSYVEIGDLEAIKAHGKIRFLIFGEQQQLLQRDVQTKSDDRAQATRFAFELGLTPVFVRVDSFADLIPGLLAGHGDVIASRMSVTDARKAQVKFTAPTAVVSEVVVKRVGEDGPTKIEELAGQLIIVRKHYAETLFALPEERRPRVEIFADDMDDEAALYALAAGGAALTVVDSDILAAVRTYNDDVERAFDLRSGQQIAWAVRPDNAALKEKANAFLTARALTKHKGEIFTGDLAGMRERGSIRVITRNNPVTYFLHKGQQYGFDYDLAKLIAKDLGLRLEVVVPPSFDQMIPYLLAGKGDFIAANFTVTAPREKEVAFSLPYLFVNEMVVQKAGAPKIENVAALAGRKIYIRESTSYNDTLKKLQRVGNFEVHFTAETLETEQIIGKVAAGEFDLAVADDTILNVEIAYGREVEAALALTQALEGDVDVIGKQTAGGQRIAYATRKGSKDLQAFLDAWVQRNYRGIDYNVLKKRYFVNTRHMVAPRDAVAKAGKISPYDDIIRKYSRRYGLDWRLMAALAYQESRFDPKAVSWVGAQGVFQVMPETGRELGFTNLQDPEDGTHAGIKYLAQLVGQFEPTLEYRQRVRFAMASYNAGLGHVEDARKLAKQQGLNPNRWFHNVEKAMLLLAEPKYAKRARYGYCRGEEPVQYVSKIQSRYDAYSRLVK